MKTEGGLFGDRRGSNQEEKERKYGGSGGKGWIEIKYNNSYV